MAQESCQVIIIGAGLSGLRLGHLLSKSSIDFKILEARNRPGGRMHTILDNDRLPIEMGATWLGKKHITLNSLLEELGLETFKQELSSRAIYEPISTSPHQLVQLPPNDQPSYRIKGGSNQLINKLKSVIPNDRIIYNEVVSSIVLEGDIVKVETNGNQYETLIVVSTLPPYLLYKTVSTKPELPDDLKHIMRQTHTWMGESIKVALSFNDPFWRSANLSGTIFSNVGPVPEMYDHSDFEDSSYALKGFLNGNYFSYTKEQRLQLVLKQLRKYYGEKVDSYQAYHETVWRHEQFTFTEYESHVLPHQNNGNQIFQNSYWNDRLFIGGSETARQHPGYMDGAIARSNDIANSIINRLSNNT